MQAAFKGVSFINIESLFEGGERMSINVLVHLLNTISIVLTIAYILSKVSSFRSLIVKKVITSKEKISIVIIFGLLGILGTSYGFPVNGALPNSGITAVLVGGLLGGPIVGIFAGVITAIYRYSVGGFVALASCLSIIFAGLIGGMLSNKLSVSKNKVALALIIGVFAELILMFLILVLAKPFSDALRLVKIIWLPMLLVNGAGVAVFIAIIGDIFKERDKAGALQAQIALNIADLTLPYLRDGLTRESANKTAEIIYSVIDNVSAIAITKGEMILAHIGIGKDHHRPGDVIKNDSTRKVLDDGQYRLAQNRKEIGCSHTNCPLKSALIVPLKKGEKIIGTLLLYKGKENGISHADEKLGIGLAQLFSTQIELSTIKTQEEMLTLSELKLLQAQINPHFLFNALNIIASLIRTNPGRARGLLVHLGNYFRTSLQELHISIPLKKELDNVRSYLAIEEARFGEKLNIQYNIDEKSLECNVPPLILQPIVENAVKHGILPKKGEGNIYIIAKKEQGYLVLTVEDDGVGMDIKTITKINDEDSSSSGIGIANVTNRLKTRYGSDNILKIFSQPGQGAKFIMNIPLQYDTLEVSK